jgi:hypothetical protein
LVLLYDQAKEPLGVGKFKPMWHSPYIVRCVLKKGTYELEYYEGNVSIFAGSRNFLVLNLVYIAAKFNCIHTWIHLIFEPSVPLATSPLAQNWKLSLHRTLFNRTEQKTSFSLLPCCHTPSDRLDGYSEGSFMGRERTGFPKTVILHLSIRVGDSTIPLEFRKPVTTVFVTVSSYVSFTKLVLHSPTWHI